MFQRKAVSSLLAFLVINVIASVNPNVGAHGSPVVDLTTTSETSDTSTSDTVVVVASNDVSAADIFDWIQDTVANAVATLEDKVEAAKDYIDEIKDEFATALAEQIANAKEQWAELKAEIVEKIEELLAKLEDFKAVVESEAESTQDKIQAIVDEIKALIDELTEKVVTSLEGLDTVIAKINSLSEEYKNKIDQAAADLIAGNENASQTIIDLIAKIVEIVTRVYAYLDSELSETTVSTDAAASVDTTSE